MLCAWCKLAARKRLCFALDFLHQEHRAFCQFYQLLSPTQRRFGPSSVVHFAKDLRTEVRLHACRLSRTCNFLASPLIISP